MSREWLTNEGEVIHPNAPRGAGGGGNFRSGKPAGAEWNQHGLPHPNSPVGRNTVLNEKHEAGLKALYGVSTSGTPRVGGAGPRAVRMLQNMITTADAPTIKNPLLAKAYADVLDIPTGLPEDSRVWLVITIMRDTIRTKLLEKIPSVNILNLDVNAFALGLIIQFRNELAIPEHDDIIFAYVDHFYQTRSEMNLSGPEHTDKMRLKTAGYDMMKIFEISIGLTPEDQKNIMKFLHTDSEYNASVSMPTIMSSHWAEQGLQFGLEDFKEDLKNQPYVFKNLVDNVSAFNDRLKAITNLYQDK
jgi:hypothetical protein